MTRYVVTLVCQVALYQLVGWLAYRGLAKRWRTAGPCPLGLRQMLGLVIVSAVVAGMAYAGLRRSAASVGLALAPVIVVLAWVARPVLPRRPFCRPAGSNRPALWKCVPATVWLIALGLLWATIAFVKCSNLIHAGDGSGWLTQSWCWAEAVPLQINDRAPVSVLAEGLHLILLGRPDLNSATLATCWLHVLAIAASGWLCWRLRSAVAALTLMTGLSLLSYFVVNVLLAYRDALVAQWTVATLLAALWFLKNPDDPPRSLAWGLTFAIAALTKHEGMLFGAICSISAASYHLASRGATPRATRLRQLVAPIAVVCVVVGLWWAMRLAAAKMGIPFVLRDFRTLSVASAIENLSSPARWDYVRVGLWKNLQHPVFAAGLLGLFVGALRAEHRPVLLLAGGATAATVVAVFAMYMLTPVELEYHLATSMLRLAMTPEALALTVAVLALDAYAREPSTDEAEGPAGQARSPG